MVDWPMRRAPRAFICAIVTGLLLAMLASLPGMAAAQEPITQTVLATRRLDEAPKDRRWVLRRGHPLNENAHAHAGGFILAALGPTYLVIDDSAGHLMPEGEAAWAPEGIGHLHTTAFRASNGESAVDEAGKEVWTILLERETEARQPGALAISPPLQGLTDGPYDARLVLLTFQAGAATGMRRLTGPELAYVLDGTWALQYDGVELPLASGQAYLADPGVPHRLRNVGTTPGRLLSALLVPGGQPAETPVPDSVRADGPR